MLLDEKKEVYKYPACTTEPGIASFLFMGQNASPATSVCVKLHSTHGLHLQVHFVVYKKASFRFFSEESAVTISTVKRK